jgi:hypothetical protein
VAEEVEGGALHHPEDLVGGGRPAGVALQPADVGPGEDGRHPGRGVIGAPRVDDEDRQPGVVLVAQAGQGLLEPGAGVVGDDDGDDHRRLGLGFHGG